MCSLHCLSNRRVSYGFNITCTAQLYICLCRTFWGTVFLNMLIYMTQWSRMFFPILKLAEADGACPFVHIERGRSPVYTNQLAHDGQWWKIWFFEVVTAIEMCEVCLMKRTRLWGFPALGGYRQRAGRFACVLLPTSHHLFVNSPKEIAPGCFKDPFNGGSELPLEPCLHSVF